PTLIRSHPILKTVIDLSIERIEAEDYGYRDLYITGPIALGDAFRKHYGLPDNSEINEGVYAGNVRILRRKTPNYNYYGNIYDATNRPVIQTKYECHLAERQRWNTTPYSELWKQKRVFSKTENS